MRIFLDESVHRCFKDKNLLVKLRTAGVNTLNEFLDREPENAAEICEFPPEVVMQIRLDLWIKFAPQIYSSFDLLERFHEEETKRQLLRPGKITEIFGAAGSGKTQFCLAETAKVIRRETGNVVYFDTKNDFFARRLAQILNDDVESDKNISEKLDKVKVKKAFDLEDIIKGLEFVAQQKCHWKNIGLVVLDNVATPVLPLFESEPLNRISFSVSKVISLLRNIAVDFECPVLVVNNTTLKTHDDEEKEAEIRPSLGSLFSSAANIRIHLEGNKFKVQKGAKNAADREYKVTAKEGIKFDDD